jgi:hypothetical protein
MVDAFCQACALLGGLTITGSSTDTAMMQAITRSPVA